MNEIILKWTGWFQKAKQNICTNSRVTPIASHVALWQAVQNGISKGCIFLLCLSMSLWAACNCPSLKGVWTVCTIFRFVFCVFVLNLWIVNCTSFLTLCFQGQCVFALCHCFIGSKSYFSLTYLPHLVFKASLHNVWP